MNIPVANKKSLLLLMFAALVCLAGYVFYSYSPYTSGLFPRCPIIASTGFQCTGCGSQRAFHDLMHLRIGSAFASNPLAVLALPYLLLGYIAEWKASTSAFWSRLRKSLFGAKAVWVALVVIVVFTVGRNVV